MDFYQVLLEIMDEKSFSIPDVARVTGLSDSTVRSIISRKTKKVSLDVAFKMYKGLGVSLERLNGEETKDNIKDNNLSKEETTLLENYNKLNALGKKEANKRVAELTEIKRYLNNTTDEITATTDNVVELNNKKITYDDFETVAAHNDNLTDDEISEADRRILADINKRNSK